MSEKITDDFEVIIKSPRTKRETKNYYDMEGKIGGIYDKEIAPLMKKATEALNNVMKWNDPTRSDEIKNMNEKQIRDKIVEDANKCKNAYDNINKKVEEIFGEMEDVEITTTGMSTISSRKIIDSLF